MKTIAATFSLAVLASALGACVTTADVRPMRDGVTLYQEGQYLAAADAFSTAIAQDPRSAAAWSNRAVTRVRLGDLDGAIRDYNQAVRLTPTDAELYFNRGNAYVIAGHYPEAIADFTRAIELNPVYPRAWFNRGTAYARSGRLDVARREWLHAVEIEPDPWARAAMRRSAGLEPPLVTAAAVPLRGEPTTAGTVAPPPPPGSLPAATPPPATPLAVVVPPPPAASPAVLDARSLATRAITRELDGDRAGAIQDLQAAQAIEPSVTRRDAIANLLRLLGQPR